MLTFPKHLKQEAEYYISQLSTYLHHVDGNDILTLLTTEGAVQATSSQWDEEKLCAILHLDMELDAVFDEADNKDWVTDVNSSVIQFDQKQMEVDARLYEKSTGVDSASKFASIKRPTTDSTNVIKSVTDTPSHHESYNLTEDGNVTKKLTAR